MRMKTDERGGSPLYNLLYLDCNVVVVNEDRR